MSNFSFFMTLLNHVLSFQPSQRAHWQDSGQLNMHAAAVKSSPNYGKEMSAGLNRIAKKKGGGINPPLNSLFPPSHHNVN